MWILILCGYSLLRAVLAWPILARYGINPAAFLFLDVVTAYPLALGQVRIVAAFRAQDFAAAQTATSTVLQDPPALAQERAWMSLVVGRHIASSTPLPTVDAARMLADVQDIGLRDHAWTLIPRDLTWLNLVRGPGGIDGADRVA